MTRLIRMEELSYPAFLELAVQSYVHDNVASGRWSAEDAPALARAETERMLPQGIATPDNHLFEIREPRSAQTVGYLWAAALNRGVKKVGYVVQILVLPEFRRQGHARAALQEFEPVAKELGFDTIALNVFASNTAAQALYRSLGFSMTSMSMHKDLA